MPRCTTTARPHGLSPESKHAALPKMRCALRRVVRRFNAAPTDVALTASCCLASCAVPHAERQKGKAQWALRTCERRSAATNAGFDFPFAITSTCALETFALLWHRGGLGLVSARAGAN